MIATAVLEEIAELIVPVKKIRFQRHTGATHPSSAAEAHEQLRNRHSGSAPVPLNDVFSLLEELIGTDLEMVHEEPACGDPDRTGADTSLIESDLGWKARWSLHGGLQAQIDRLARSATSELDTSIDW